MLSNLDLDQTPEVNPGQLPNSSNPPVLRPFDSIIQKQVEDEEDGDIFRGDRPLRPLSIPASVISSSSSSSASILGGRFTAIAAVVELAISRWAKATSGSSDTSSDTSSTRSSLETLSRRRLGRRRPRTSMASLHSQPSERDLAARYRAREQLRNTPREFVLYLPPSLHPAGPSKVSPASRASSERIFRTTSFSLILSQLESALKKASKGKLAHRSRPNSSARFPATQLHAHQDYMLPDPMLAPSCPASFTDLTALKSSKKGKERESQPKQTPTPLEGDRLEQNIRAPKTWWLDVSSPTWEDMRAIGKLLHLHPLTLEDILQQDPREKLELFPKLGYYFLSFRAIESKATRDRFRRFNAADSDHGEYRDEVGVVGEVNVYLVVFREGICSFHFADIAEHIDHVRNKVTLLEDTVNMSSDWIAHGVLDSVVDSFFPLVKEVEKDIVEVDNIVYSDNPHRNTAAKTSPILTSPDANATQGPAPYQMKSEHAEISQTSVVEKPTSHLTLKREHRMRFSVPRPTISLFFRRCRRTLLSLPTSFYTTKHNSRTANPKTPSTLQRMARTRRLVTSLQRLLATKSEVVTQIRKRLLTSSQSGLGNGSGKHDIEVAIHMGDIQDHILTLQHSLGHYERMLSQSHPTYLSQLRVSVAAAKSGTDKAAMILTVVSMSVLTNQTVIGIFSMNCTVPHNDIDDPGGRYNLFGIVIALNITVLALFFSTVRRWWLQAKRRRGGIL